MDLPKAKSIFKEIEERNNDPEEKLLAIQTLLDREAFSKITKSECISALRWILEEYL